MSDRVQGEHAEAIRQLQADVSELRADMKEVRDFVVGVKARWRMASAMLVGVGAFVGAVFAFAADLAKTAFEKRYIP